MFISKHSCAFAILSTFVGLAAGSTGCSASPSDNADVSGRGEIINHTKSALKSGDITAIGGTYGAGCTTRASAGTDTWSVNMTTANAADLTVVKGNAGCVLTMTSITAGAAVYNATPAISMIAAYAATASAFTLSGGTGDTMFYGNAMLDALTFTSDFHLSVLVSDDTSETDAGAKAAGWATRSGTATAGTVPASNYTFSIGTYALTKDVNGVVDADSGYAQLTEGVSPLDGEDYVIVTGSPTSFAQVDAAFGSSSILPVPADLQLPAYRFALVGTDLTNGQVRTVIIRHTDAGSGVSSYQTFTITFTI